MAFQFPIIDLKQWTAGDGSRRSEVARRTAAACESIGFVGITGHGVGDDLVATMRDVSLAFFDLADAEKRQVARPKPEQNRGYHAYGTETLARLAGKQSPPDYKEVLAIGPPGVPNHPYYHELPGAYPNYAPNLWPSRPAALEPTWRAYWHAMEGLSISLTRLFAAALDLPPDYFLAMTDRHCSMLRALHYPEQRQPPLPGQLRAGEHTDLGMFTVLKNDSVAGSLEVMDRAGAWHVAPALPEGFIVNLGDVMMRWTNDRFLSTRHRVANPPPGRNGPSRRLSLAFFYMANHDAMIECVPTCCGPDRPARYPAISISGYRNQRFARTATVE